MPIGEDDIQHMGQKKAKSEGFSATAEVRGRPSVMSVSEKPTYVGEVLRNSHCDSSERVEGRNSH